MNEDEFNRLFAFSEWLDSEGVIRDEYETGDDRSHEDLVNAYLEGKT